MFVVLLSLIHILETNSLRFLFPFLGCCACCCSPFRARYKRLVDNIFPPNYQVGFHFLKSFFYFFLIDFFLFPSYRMAWSSRTWRSSSSTQCPRRRSWTELAPTWRSASTATSRDIASGKPLKANYFRDKKTSVQFSNIHSLVSLVCLPNKQTHTSTAL